MKRHALHITISIVAIFLAAGHLVFPAARIDAVTLALVLVAILPWLGSVFRSVELPGGLKVEYKDLEKVEEEAQKAGLLAAPTTKKELPAYAIIAGTRKLLLSSSAATRTWNGLFLASQRLVSTSQPKPLFRTECIQSTPDLVTQGNPTRLASGNGFLQS